MELSIILTAHNEGLLLHRAILSLIESIKQLPRPTKVELMMHLDKGDVTTKKYLTRCQDILDFPKDTTFTLVEGKIGDLGLSRNHALEFAKGKYIFFMDADDLISQNFLERALTAVRQNDKVLYHPEMTLSFGRYTEILMRTSIRTREEAVYALCSYNPWPSTVFGKKEIFAKYPYRAATEGYGYEDYMFNTETIADGIMHYALTNTILFYRRKNNSLSVTSQGNNVVQPPSKLLDFKFFRKIDLDTEDEDKALEPAARSLKSSAVELYKKVRQHKLPNLVIQPLAELGKKVTGKKLVVEEIETPEIATIMNAEIYEQWLAISDIETQLFPSEAYLKTVPIIHPELKVSQAYWKIAQTARGASDYVFIVPWVRVGGADKALSHYINALLKLNSKAKITVITTVPDMNEAQNTLPKNVTLIDFGEQTKQLCEREQDELFSRVLVQLRCKRVHVINSEYAYLWLKRHLEYAKHHLKVSVSLFKREPLYEIDERAYFDYAEPFATDIAPVLSGIYTDNQKTADWLVKRNGFDPKIVQVHYLPVEVSSDNVEVSKRELDTTKKHLLWAGRICRPKNPELLAQIAQQIDNTKYQIHVFGKFDEGADEKIFDNLPSLIYHGAYNNIAEINPGAYDALLYTSISDGLPNVLLEVAQYDLPIIASNVGGIGDFVMEGKTGFLIDDYRNPEPYLAAIKKLFADEKNTKRLAQQAHNLVRTRHANEQFIKQVQRNFVEEK